MITVITCTYNRPSMLREAVSSLRAQTLLDYEHILIDNGSTDPAVDAVLAWAVEDPRVRILRRVPNVDQPAKRWNEGIDLARGEYICFLDDDNTKLPAFLERLSAVLDADPSVDVATCGFVARFPDGHSEENHLNLRTAELILERNTVDTGCFMIRRSALERIGYFPEDIRTNEDWALVKRMYTVLRVVHLKDCLATWREHAGQRMAYCKELGNDADKARIRGSDWRPNLGVQAVCGPDAPDEEIVFTFTIAAIPWVRRGDDVLVAYNPNAGVTEGIWSFSRTGRPIVLIVDVDHASDGVDCARVLSAHPNLWIATEGPSITMREIAGDRTIAWRGEGTWRARMARILNCVRSPRFGAAIP